MALTIVPYYAALFGLGLILLSARVIRLRRRVKIAIGSGGAPVLERAIRVQGNFSEYVPLTLLLLAFVELGGGASWIVHGLCLALLAGRVVHAAGLSRTEEDYRYRISGMVATLTVLGMACIILLTGGSLLIGLFA